LQSVRERFFDTPRPSIRPIRRRRKKKNPFAKEKEEGGRSEEKRRKEKIDESQRTKARDTTTGKETLSRLQDRNQKGEEKKRSETR